MGGGGSGGHESGISMLNKMYVSRAKVSRAEPLAVPGMINRWMSGCDFKC